MAKPPQDPPLGMSDEEYRKSRLLLTNTPAYKLGRASGFFYGSAFATAVALTSILVKRLITGGWSCL